MSRIDADDLIVGFLIVFVAVWVAVVLSVAIDNDESRCDRYKALAAEGNELAAVEAVKRCD